MAAYLLLPDIAAAQGLMGALIGTVKDEQGGVLAGASVRINSPALIGGPEILLTTDKGHLRFPSLPPGLYSLAIELQGGKPWTASAQIALPQGAQRVLLEPRGSRRLSSQTLLDVRLSTAITWFSVSIS